MTEDEAYVELHDSLFTGLERRLVEALHAVGVKTEYRDGWEWFAYFPAGEINLTELVCDNANAATDAFKSYLARVHTKAP